MKKRGNKDPRETERKQAKAIYCESLKLGTSHKEAQEATGKGESTIWEWRQKDPDFVKAIDKALISRIKIVEDSLFATATGKEGKAKVIAQIFWLKNRGKNWKDKQDITFIAPKIVNQKVFIQSGNAPIIEEEEPEPIPDIVIPVKKLPDIVPEED